MCCVRGPSSRTGRIFVVGSRARATAPAQFIQLDRREPEMGEEVCIQGGRVYAYEPARVNQVVMVAGRKPKTREAAEGSSPSGSRVIPIMATWDEGVLRRYRAVVRRARERGTTGLTPKGL